MIEYAIIYWKDAVGHGEMLQMTREEWKKSTGILSSVSAGMIVDETKEYISLALDCFYAGADKRFEDFRTVASYPKSCITKIIRHRVTL